MTITILFYAVSTNKLLFSFPCPLEHIYNQFTSPPSQASTLHLRQQAKFPAHTLQLFHSNSLLLKKALGTRCPLGKQTNKASILSSTHTSGRPAWCARTGLPPAPNARERGTQRKGWWSQLGHRTGGHRWRRCRRSIAAWPTGTAWGESQDRFKGLLCFHVHKHWEGKTVSWWRSHIYPSHKCMWSFGPSNFMSRDLSCRYVCTCAQKIYTQNMSLQHSLSKKGWKQIKC